MKKNGKKLIWAALATIALALPVGLGLGQKAQAAETDTATITLHKRDTTETISNPDGSEVTAPGNPLSGAEFTLYDITDQYYQLLTDDTSLTNDTAIAKIVKATDDSIVKTSAAAANDQKNYYITNKVGAEVTTDANGEAVFSNLATKNATTAASNAGRDKIYLILETVSPNNVVAKSAPVVVTLPIYKTGTNEINNNIHVYPKNETQKNTKEITSVTENGTLVDKASDGNYDIDGESVISYTINVNIPTDIASKARFDVIDTPDKGLTFIYNSLSLTALDAAGSQIKVAFDSSDYTLYQGNDIVTQLNANYANNNITSTNGFYLAFTEAGREKLKANNVTKLAINYTMKLDQNNIVTDTALQNNAYINFNTTPKIPEVPVNPGTDVTTGGAKFLKADAHTKKALAGAEFVVSNAANQFAQFEKVGGVYVLTKWVASQAAATKVVSGDSTAIANQNATEANLVLADLTDCTYQLQETSAPAGYALLTDPTEFKVVKGSAATTAISTKVLNTPKGILPSTGGIGIVAFIVVGLAAIAGVAFYFLKGRKNIEA